MPHPDSGTGAEDSGDTTLKTRLAGATHWSARVLAAKLGVSRMMVQRVWQRYDVQPHRVQT